MNLAQDIRLLQDLEELLAAEPTSWDASPAHIEHLRIHIAGYHGHTESQPGVELHTEVEKE
mgnify:CR=1 FL=1